MAGKPLLGVDEGFTRYQVREGRTGLCFEPTVASVRETVRRFDPDDFDATRSALRPAATSTTASRRGFARSSPRRRPSTLPRTRTARTTPTDPNGGVPRGCSIRDDEDDRTRSRR